MRSSCQHCAGVYNSISGIIRPVGSGGWDITACGWAIGSRSTNLADKLRGKHSVGLATAPVNEVWADNTSLPSPLSGFSSCLRSSYLEPFADISFRGGGGMNLRYVIFMDHLFAGGLFLLRAQISRWVQKKEYVILLIIDKERVVCGERAVLYLLRWRGGGGGGEGIYLMLFFVGGLFLLSAQISRWVQRKEYVSGSHSVYHKQ